MGWITHALSTSETGDRLEENTACLSGGFGTYLNAQNGDAYKIWASNM